MPPPSSRVTIYRLEMRDPQSFRPKAAPPGFTVEVVVPPDPEVNRRFYCEVGSQWNWIDRLAWSQDDWHRYAHSGAVTTCIGHLYGHPVGYFELKSTGEGSIEIAYFGLLPEFIGRGLGGALLSEAIQRAWNARETHRVSVHTCTHDHPYALENYRKRGFEMFKVEQLPS